MRCINIPMDDSAFDSLIILKGSRTWKQFLFSLPSEKQEATEVNITLAEAEDLVVRLKAEKASLLDKRPELERLKSEHVKAAAFFKGVAEAKQKAELTAIQSGAMPEALLRFRNMIQEAMTASAREQDAADKIDELLSSMEVDVDAG